MAFFQKNYNIKICDNLEKRKKPIKNHCQKFQQNQSFLIKL